MKIPKEKWPTFLNPELTYEKNVYKVMSRLTARPLSRTFLIEVKVAASTPDSLEVLINTVMATLVERVSKEQEDRFSKRLNYLGEEKTKIEKRLNNMREGVLAVADKAGSAAFLNEAYDAHLSQLNILQGHSLEAERDMLWATSDLTKTDAYVKSVRAESIEPLAAIRIADDPGINRMESWTYEKLHELRAGIDGLTSDNEDRQYVEKRMNNMREYLGNYRVEAQSKIRNSMSEERDYKLRQVELEVAAEALMAKERSDEMSRRYEEALATANQVSAAIYKASVTSRAIARAEERVAALTLRIHDTQLLARSPVPVAIEEFARPPSSPASSNLTKLAGAGVVFSFSLIVGICLIVDFVDGRIRTKEDLETAFGGPVAAIIEDKPHTESPLAVKQFAARLARQANTHTAMVHMLCGITSRAGTTTIVRYLSESLMNQGVANTIITVNDLSADAVASQIASLKADTNLILVDAPALSESDTSIHLCGMTDSTTVVVHADLNRSDETAVAVNQLLAMHVPAMAVILNFTGPRPGDWLFRRFIPRILGALSAVRRITRKIVST